MKIYKGHMHYKCPMCQKKLVPGKEIKLFNVSIKVADTSIVEALKSKHEAELDARIKVIFIKMPSIRNFVDSSVILL